MAKGYTSLLHKQNALGMEKIQAKEASKDSGISM